MKRQDLLVGKALLSAVRDGNERDWAQPAAVTAGLIDAGLELPRLVEAAAWHRVDGYVWLSVRSLAKTREFRASDLTALQALETQYLSAVAIQLRALSDLRSIAGEFDRFGIAYAVLKGPVLAELAYPRPDLRSYEDLDILVAPDALGAALDHLESIGAIVLDENWDMLTDRRAGEVRVQMPSGTALDVHWSLFNELPVRQAFSVGTQRVLAGVHRCDVGGVTVPVLERTDAMVHVAIHACLSGGNKLGWLKDVEQSVLHYFGGWPALVERCREWHAEIPVATMLVRTSRSLGLPVPPDVLHQLAPASWCRFVAAVDRVSPNIATPTDGSLSRLVGRAVRVDARSSLLELMRRGGSWASSKARHTRHPLIWDPSDRGSAAFASGQRAAFLADVSRQP